MTDFSAADLDALENTPGSPFRVFIGAIRELQRRNETLQEGWDTRNARLSALDTSVESLGAQRDALAEALRIAEDWICQTVPANSYGLLDRDEDNRRKEVLVVVRAAIAKLEGK